MSETKAERERTFHNEIFKATGRSSVAKFYDVVGASRSRYPQLLAEEPSGRRVLELGCGLHTSAVQLAAQGCRVIGIDISDEAITQSQEQVATAGLAASFLRMDAEHLEFDDKSFDLVCGSGVIHHLDTAVAYREIARVLRPGGRAIFVEPLGHNPAINAFRKRTLSLRTVDEHPLLRSDLRLASDYFSAARFQYFELAALAAVGLRGTPIFAPALKALQGLDRLLLRTPARYWAWNVVMELRR